VAPTKHLYCVARGDYVNSSLAAERWQMGVRLWADVSVPADQGGLPNTGDYSFDDAAGSDSLGSYTSSWKWTVGLGTVIVPIDYLKNQAGPAWKTFIQNANLYSNLRLKEVHLYPIDETGKAFEGRSAVLVYATPPVGAGVSGQLPTEVSSALSWQTPVVGRRGRGRIFVPCLPQSAIDTNGFLTSSWTSNLVSRGQTFLTSMAVESVSPTATHVRPIVTGKPYQGYGVITHVSVGNVADSQRRRRRQLVETRTGLDVTYG
jgi:hypothetical protein